MSAYSTNIYGVTPVEVTRVAQSDVKLAGNPVQTLYIPADSSVTVLVDSLSVRHVTVIVEKRSKCNIELMVPSGGSTTLHCKTVCGGQDSHIQVRCVGLLRDKQFFNLELEQCHVGSNSSSDMDVRIALQDNSSANVKGRIIVEKTGHQSTASFKNYLLTLGSKVGVVSQPELEIENNDVQCKHSAAVTSLDKEKLFFMSSRGILLDKATKILVDAFLTGGRCD